MKLDTYSFDGSRDQASNWHKDTQGNGKWVLAEEVTRLTLDVIQIAEHVQGLLREHRCNPQAERDVRLSIDFLEQIIQQVDQNAPREDVAQL